jgi:hypothetical protein
MAAVEPAESDVLIEAAACGDAAARQRLLEGLPFREIAAVLGISESAAKVRHFRALERLRKLSDHEEFAGVKA